MQFLDLNDDERVITETAAAFAAKRLAPYTLEWDASKHFPVDVLREAAGLGMAAIYCRDDVGGSGLRRLDGVRIFEQLAIGNRLVQRVVMFHVEQFTTREVCLARAESDISCDLVNDPSNLRRRIPKHSSQVAIGCEIIRSDYNKLNWSNDKN